MTVRAKFIVNSITERKHWDKTKPNIFEVDLSAVSGGSPENQAFFAASPSGSIKLGTINKAAADALVLGSEVYVDFTPAVAPVAAE